MTRFFPASFLFLSMLWINPTQAQTQRTGNPPTSMQHLLGRMSPVAQAIIARQCSKSTGVAAKPTEDEQLRARVDWAEAGSMQYFDSIAYVYSGSRTSNISSALFTYLDNYEPVSYLQNNPYAQYDPNLKYDTATHYTTTSGGSTIVTRWHSRTYDAGDLVIGQFERDFSSSIYGPGQKYDAITYDTEGNMINGIRYFDTSASYIGAYQVQYRLDALYDGNNRVADTLQSWLGAGGYDTAGYSIYTYDGAGLMTTMLTANYVDWSGTWVNGNRHTYSYDAMGRLSNDRYDLWSGAGWTAAVQDTFGYTGTSGLFTFYEHRNNYDNYKEKTINTLNSIGAWDSVWIYTNYSGVYDLERTCGYHYNANNHISHYEGLYYYNGPTNPGPFRTTFYYGAPNSIRDVADKALRASFAALAPNPAKDRATIAVANPRGHLHLAITNMAGQTLYEQSAPATNTLNLSTTALPAGIYQVVLHMGNAEQSLKLVKE